MLSDPQERAPDPRSGPRNIVERLPKSLHASTRRALRQAGERDDADKAERLIRNLAPRLERDASMALRWTAAGMMEAAKSFRRLKAHEQLPALRAAFLAHQAAHSTTSNVETNLKAA